jgi:outer membrane lipoprotein SlyB
MVVNGRRVGIDARVVRLSESGLDKSKAGLGAIIGGVLGAVIDGGKGALIGAIVGGTGAVVASSGDEVELPAGTILTIRLERRLAIARR